MECKYGGEAVHRNPNGELIDTLWNVNTISPSVGSSGTVELIDTLWNVN